MIIRFMILLFVISGTVFAQEKVILSQSDPSSKTDTLAPIPTPFPTKIASPEQPSTQTDTIAPTITPAPTSVTVSQKHNAVDPAPTKLRPARERKWSVGGGIGLSFGYATTIQLSPTLSYQLTPWMDAGVVLDYIYQSYNSTTAYGGGVFLRPFIGHFFGLAEYDLHQVNNQYHGWSNTLEENYSTEALWLGGGYRQRIGKHSFMYIGGSYNVLYDDDISLYDYDFRPYVGISIGI